MHFLRTGATSCGGEKRYVGQLDAPLCEKGEKRLLEMRGEFVYPPVDMVFTSPLSRCVKTSAILYPDTYTENVDGLMDIGLGVFEGKGLEELRTDEAFSKWISDSVKNPPPDGESMQAFTERIIGAAGGIFSRMMREKITNAAVITHGGVIMTLLAAIGVPKIPLHEWACQNGAGYTLIFTTQMWMQCGSAEVFCRLPMLKGDN